MVSRCNHLALGVAFLLCGSCKNLRIFPDTKDLDFYRSSAAISNPNNSNEVKTRKYEPHKTEGFELSAFHKQECISFFTRGYSHEMTLRYG
jgi:hypothetical protein